MAKIKSVNGHTGMCSSFCNDLMHFVRALNGKCPVSELRFEALTVMCVKITVFCDVMCSSLVHFFLDEILGSAVHRCLDPVLMEGSVVQKICERG